jgi:hypothetical protein
MAKKQRRKQQPRNLVSQAAAPAVRAPVAVSPGNAEQRRAVAPSATTSKARPGSTWCEFQDHYRHVNGELKQIGIIAGSFLVVLLVLALILG